MRVYVERLTAWLRDDDARTEASARLGLTRARTEIARRTDGGHAVAPELLRQTIARIAPHLVAAHDRMLEVERAVYSRSASAPIAHEAGDVPSRPRGSATRE